MTLKRIGIYSVALAMLCFVGACGSTTKETVNISLELSGDGPFFQGPNSLMADYEVKLTELVEGKDLSSSEIKSANLLEAKVDLAPNDELSLTDFESASLQMVSENQGMSSVAVLNPISGEGTEMALQTSAEADLAPYLNDGKFTTVLDLGFKNDAFVETVKAKLDLKIELEIK